MPLPKTIIGLTGGQGRGKSAFARELVANHGFTRMALADPIKLAVRVILDSWGYNTAAQDYWIDGDGKEKSCPALGYKSPRHATPRHRAGRLGLDGGIWVRHLLARVEVATAQRIVVDDVRVDKAEAIIVAGGFNFVVVGKDGRRARASSMSAESVSGPSRDRSCPIHCPGDLRGG